MSKSDQCLNSFYFVIDQATSIHYVEIGGVNSVVATSPNSVPNTPYSVMHTFAGEDFASEDVASLTVHYSTEETFPPQTPVSADSSHGICFPFNTSDTYATTSHSNVVFTTGTPLPSPGVHYVQADMDVEASEELGSNESHNTEQVRSEGYVIRKQNSGTEGYIVREEHLIRRQNSDTEGYIVREQTSPGDGYIVQERHIVQEQHSDNESYIVQEQTSPSEGYIIHEENSSPEGYIEQSPQGQEYIARAQSSKRGKNSDDLTLPTMVVFTSPESEPSTTDVRTDREDRHGNDDSSENNLGTFTLRQRCESTSIGRFAPPSIIFQVKENYSLHLMIFLRHGGLVYCRVKQTCLVNQGCSAPKCGLLYYFTLTPDDFTCRGTVLPLSELLIFSFRVRR